MSERGSPRSEERNPVEHFCTTNSNIAVTSMEWTILNFNLLKFDSGRSLKSSSFESVQDGISTGTWTMKLVPKPMYANEDELSVFLVHSGHWRGLFVGLDIWIVDADGKATNKKKTCFEMSSSEIGIRNFIKRSDLLDSHLPNGNLTLHCYVAVVPLDKVLVKKGKPYADDSPRRGCSNLLKEGVFSDAVLVCEDRRFRVHKCILSVRSSVFRELFQQNVADEFAIEDIEADILESLLSYIYTDSIQGKCTINMAINLLKEAEKHCLFELEDICEEFLETNLSVYNLLEVASIAESHKLNSLKEVCINFMSAHGKDIVFSRNFKEFLNTVPQFLLIGVLVNVLNGSELKQQLTSRPTRTSPFAKSRSPGQRDAIEKAVVKGNASSPKQTFIFGFSNEDHPGFSLKEKVPQ